MGANVIDRDADTRIVLRNGAAILALPGGNAAAIHGWTGSVFMDELSRIPNADECFKAAYFVTSPTPARPQGYRLSAASTPNGAAGVFWELAETKRGAGWAIHKTDIHNAVADGFPMDIEKEKALVADPDSWAEQMECSFTSGESAYIKAELYDSCTIPRTKMAQPTARIVGGYDVARTRDASVLVLGHVDGNGILWVGGCDAMRGLAWHVQKDWLRGASTGGRRVVIDATGLGSQLAEEMVKEIPGFASVTFSSSTQREQVYTELKRRFLTNTVRVADDLRELRNAVTSIRRTVTQQGNVSYVLPRSAEGHADEAIALALCCYAAMDPGKVEARVTSCKRDSATIGSYY